MFKQTFRKGMNDTDWQKDLKLIDHRQVRLPTKLTGRKCYNKLLQTFQLINQQS